jgi:hypothetical protein
MDEVPEDLGFKRRGVTTSTVEEGERTMGLKCPGEALG